MRNFHKNGRLSSHTQKKWGRHILQKFYVRHNILNQKKQFFSSKFGLGGPPSATACYNKIIIWRPFIQFSRFELLKFCEFWNLPIFPDLTNFCLSLRRNRLRLQSLPYLKYFFNLNLLNKIEQIQKILDFENQYFQWILQKLYPFYFNIENFLIPKSVKHKKPCPRSTPIYLNQVFEYLPNVFKYRILHYLFLFFKKKISFLEIDCILKKNQV